MSCGCGGTLGAGGVLGGSGGGALVGVAPSLGLGVTYGADPDTVQGAVGWYPGRELETVDIQRLPEVRVTAAPAFPWWLAVLVIGATLALGGRK